MNRDCTGEYYTILEKCNTPLHGREDHRTSIGRMELRTHFMKTVTILSSIFLTGELLFSQFASPRLRPLPPASKDVATGPGVGERIPAFRLTDQTGQLRDFKTLTGKNGLLLVFVRSADW